jgi:hypothetical protein
VMLAQVAIAHQHSYLAILKCEAPFHIIIKKLWRYSSIFGDIKT